jgi:hypothetical protein
MAVKAQRWPEVVKVSLSSEQLAAARRLAERDQASLSQLGRRALVRYLEEQAR